MRAWLLILVLLIAVVLARGQGSKTPINNGILQSDLNAAGYKITNANLVDYAGTGLNWNAVTGKFDATGGGGGGGTGTPGGSTTQLQYNNAGAFNGIPTVTYDGTIPLTITKDGGGGTRFTGIKLVNPTNATVNAENRQAPGIHLIENVKTSGVVHTYDHMIWGENGNLMFGTSTDNGGYGGTGKAIVAFDPAGNIVPGGGDQTMVLASISGLDYVQTGGDGTHTPKAAIFNDSTPSVPGLGLANNGVIWWDSGAGWSLNEGDTKLTRSAAGVVKVKNAMELTPVAVASLPAGSLGRMATVNDGAASLAFGATVTGGGSTKYEVWHNGTNWTVTGGGTTAGGGAPTTATYITQTVDAGLSAEVALSTLATGLLKSTITTGALTTITDNSTNWNTAFTQTRQWDGGATGLVAATGRTSLALVIGTNVEAWDADLDTWATLTPSANFQTMVPHTFAQMRTDLGLVIGTNVAAATSGSSVLSGNGSGGFTNVTIGSDLNFASSTLTTVHSVTFAVDGAGSVLTTGTKNPLKVDFGGTLQGWSMMCKPSGSVTADVFRAANAGGLPTTSIVGAGTKPAISSGVENSSSTFTSWTSTTITAKDNLAISITSATTATFVELTLYWK